MKRKLSKIGKSSVSVLLCLVMLLTTFCFFDIGSVISDAMVTVTENNKMTGSLSSQFMYAPEIAYLTPGSSTFKYFSNYDPASGNAYSSSDTTSRLEFEYKGASEVSVAVNKVYYKNGELDVGFGGVLKINGTNIDTYAAVGSDNDTWTTSPTVIATGTNSINYTLNASNCSLSGTTAGTTYYIQWVFRYKVDNNYHVSYMYTGVYVPLLDQAGISSDQRYIASGSNPTENHSWSFITGAMRYTGGNRKSLFTGTTANTLRCAPLISFVGSSQNGSAYTIPGGDANSTSEINFSSSASPYNTFVYSRGSRGANELFYTTTYSKIPSSYTEDAEGSISLTSTDMSAYQGITTGTAYIVVDTSRYSNYNQIPYLSAGYAQFYHDMDGNGNKLNSIKSVQRYNPGSTTAISYDGTIYCNVDSSNWTDGDSASVARGLYPFNGSIVSGLVTFDTWFYNGFQHFIGYTENLGVHHYNGLFTQTVNKQTLRTAYNDAAHSHIDHKTYSSSYSNYYSELKAVAETLCDPQLYSKTTTSLSGTGTGSVKAIEDSIVNSTTTTNDYVYFYVPEAVYLTPSTSTSSGTFNAQYVLNQTVSLSNDVCTQTVNTGYDTIETGGTVYFYYKNASKVKITCSADNGVTFTPTLSSSNNIKATNTYYNCSDRTLMKLNFTTDTKTNYYKSCYVTWTATYVEENVEKSVTAKTYVYAPNTSTVAGTAGAGNTANSSTNRLFAAVTSWIVGFHSILNSKSGDNSDQTGGAINNPMQDSTVTKLYHPSYGGSENPLPSGTGANWFYKRDTDASVSGGTAIIYVDISRTKKYNQIPNFTVGVDINNGDSWSSSGSKSLVSKFIFGSSHSTTNADDSNFGGTEIKSASGRNNTDLESGKRYTYIPDSDISTSYSCITVASRMQIEKNKNRSARAWVFCDFSYSDRSGLRQAVEYANKYNYALQAGYFNGSTEWTTYTSALANAQNALTKVDGTADFGAYNTDSSKRSGLAKTLMDAVDTLVSKTRGTAPRNTNNYTATQTNVGLIAQSDGSYKVAAIAEAVSDGTATIAKSFKAYDKLEFTAESYSGYDYIGYYKDGVSSTGSVISKATYDGIRSSTDVVQQSKNDSLIFGNALNTAYSYTFYYLLKPDVLFDNEFDFDSIIFTNGNGLKDITADYANNSLSMTSTATDCYVSDGSTRMKLIGGHTYRVTYDFSSTNGGKPRCTIMPYSAASGGTWGGAYYIENLSSGGTFTVNEAYPYVFLRFGITCSTTGINGTYSNVYVQDITNLDGFTDDVTEATPHGYYNLTAGEKLGSVAGIERTGYAFDGWYDSQDSTGNGTGTQYTANSVVKPYNVRLYAKWVLAPELMFGNEFVFDNIASDINSGTNNMSNIRVDYASNKIRFSVSGSDAYTGAWDGIKSAMFGVTAGNTYRLAMEFSNLASSDGKKEGRVYIFFFDSSKVNLGRQSFSVYAEKGASVILNETITAPDGAAYATLRFGADDRDSSVTAFVSGDTFEYKDIYVQNLTNPAGNCDDNVTIANPINKVKLAGQTVGTLADIDRDGYKFAGWYTDRDSTGNGIGTQYTESSTMPSSNTQLWAKWEVKSYTITYNADGGSVSPKSNNFTINDDVPLPTPTKSGYTFAGWKVTETDENSETPEGATETLMDNSNWIVGTTYSVGTSNVAKGMYGNVTVTAQWTAKTYSLKFDFNGGNVNGNSSVTVKPTFGSGNYNSLDSWGTPSRTGYTFAGMFTAATGGTQVYDKDGKCIPGTAYWDSSSCWCYDGDVTLYAHWTAYSYNIEYSMNNGTNNSSNPKSANYDSVITLYKPTKDGWTFTGWTLEGTNPDYSNAKYGTSSSSVTTAISNSLTKFGANGTVYLKNLSSTNGGTVKLVAHWQKTLTATFYYIDATNKTVKETKTVTIYDSATAGNVTCSTTPASVTYNSRTFTWAGWRTDTTAAAAGKTQSISADTSFYAVYKGTLTLSYNANGGTGAPTEQTADQYLNATATTGTANAFAKSKITFTVSTTKPTRSGWTFDGWATSASATSGTYGASPKTTTITSDVNTTLYAVWTKTLTATFYYYNGQSVTKTVTVYNGKESGTITAPAIESPTVSGIKYTARGWTKGNSGANATVTAEANADITISGGEKFYASYQNERTATFYYCTLPVSSITATGAAQGSVTATAIRYMNYTGGFVESQYTIPSAVTSSHGGGVAEKYLGVSTSANNATCVNSPTTANTTFYAVYGEELNLYYFDGSKHTCQQNYRYMLSNGSNYNSKMKSTVPTPSAIDSNTPWSGSWSYVSDSYNTAYFREPDKTGVNNLYAVYNRDVAIKYNMNGVTATAIADTTGTAHFISYNEAKSFPAALNVTSTKPTNANWTFISWNTKNDGSGTKYDSGAGISVSEDITLYAQWKKDVTVYFYSGKNKASVEKFTLSFVNGETTKQVTSPNKGADIADWTWLGWTTSEYATQTEANSKKDGNIALSVDVNIGPFEYYAIYSQEQTLTYNSNAKNDTTVKNIPSQSKGTAYYNSVGKTTNAGHTVSSTVPTRDGYTFFSWNTKDDGSGTSYSAGITYTNNTANDTLYAVWTEITYTITFDPAGGSVSPTDANYTIVSTTVTLPSPSKSGYTFAGWLVTKGEGSWTNKVEDKTLYNSGSLTVTGMYGNATLTAQWIYTQKADDKTTEYGTENNSIEIVLGVNTDGSDKTTTTTKYDETGWKNYQSAIEAYKNALGTFKNDVTNTTNKSKLEAAIKTLTDITLNVRKVDKSHIDAFYIKSDSTNTYSVKNINLNHYITSTLTKIKDAYTAATGADANALITSSVQKTINDSVRTLAEQYINKDNVTTTPSYKVYENGDKIKDALGASNDIDAVNYVRTVNGSSIYYCYTNKTNPQVYLTVEDSEASSGRICYPTRSTIDSNEAENSILNKLDGTVKADYEVSSKSITNSVYESYIDSGLGGTYTGTVNGQSFTGKDYYNRQSTITLKPVFTDCTNAAVKYVITSTDDSYNKEDASIGGNYAKTASLSAGKKDKDFEDSTLNSITIIIDYHKGDQLNVTSDQVDADKYLKQFHLFRNSGGARNWELPYSGDENYTVNDSTYGQKDYGSFTYTFVVTGETKLSKGELKNADVETLKAEFQNFDPATAKAFKGTNAGGDGLGYIRWGTKTSTNWSFNYYPKSNAYTYVHLVDRWGNVVDKVIQVPNLDSIKAEVLKTSSAGVYEILEAGGSGIDSLSLNAASMEILTDENSTLENNVYKTTGNTIKIKTGEANKSYTLTMKDKATNASTAALTSDENGIITLNVTDEEYTSGVYTFTLNGIEINLYDSVNNDKYIVSVTNGEAEEGEYAELSVITTGEVGKIRFTDTDGNAVTIASCNKNADGTKTWAMSKKRSVGEYEYDISVKVGNDWIEESSKGKLTFTAKILDSGLIRSAEYDAESGLYKITIEGRATKIQFITEDGMTRTYTRYNESVKSVKTYDAEENEVNDTARTLDHEVWLVNAKLYSGLKYTVAAKFEAGWNMDGTTTLTAR